jgi:hypothetical protein
MGRQCESPNSYQCTFVEKLDILTPSTPFTASSNAPGAEISGTIAKDKSSTCALCASLTLLAADSERTVPLTLNPALRKDSITWAAMKPDAPVMRTVCLVIVLESMSC